MKLSINKKTQRKQQKMHKKRVQNMRRKLVKFGGKLEGCRHRRTVVTIANKVGRQTSNTNSQAINRHPATAIQYHTQTDVKCARKYLQSSKTHRSSFKNAPVSQASRSRMPYETAGSGNRN